MLHLTANKFPFYAVIHRDFFCHDQQRVQVTYRHLSLLSDFHAITTKHVLIHVAQRIDISCISISILSNESFIITVFAILTTYN